jgi:hypothetical protein
MYLFMFTELKHLRHNQNTKVRLSGNILKHTGCNQTYRSAKMLGVGEGEIVQTLARIKMLSGLHAQSITPETNRSLVFFSLHIPALKYGNYGA